MIKKTLLFSLMLLFSLNLAPIDSYGSESDREELLAIVRGTPGVIRAYWADPLTMWVEVRAGEVSKDEAQEIAESIASAGRKRMGKPVCVTVYYGNRHILGDKCEQ